MSEFSNPDYTRAVRRSPGIASCVGLQLRHVIGRLLISSSIYFRSSLGEVFEIGLLGRGGLKNVSLIFMGPSLVGRGLITKVDFYQILASHVLLSFNSWPLSFVTDRTGRPRSA